MLIQLNYFFPHWLDLKLELWVEQHPYMDCSDRIYIQFWHHRVLIILLNRLMLAMLRLNRDSFILILTYIFIRAFFRIRHVRRSSFHILRVYFAMFITLCFERVKLVKLIFFVLKWSFITLSRSFVFVEGRNFRNLITWIFSSFDS